MQVAVIDMREDNILFEKYRPLTLDGIVGQEHIMPFFKGYVETRQIPHMLFAGPAGVGKTTAAKALARGIFGDDWKKSFRDFNASDARKLTDIREKIKTIAQTAPVKGGYKIIHMDEADNLAHDAQPALRRIIEDYSHICRFILSCNYPNRIIEPIKDRLDEFRFKRLSTIAAGVILKKVAEAEKIQISASAISLLATLSRGSMRKALVVLDGFKKANINEITEQAIYDKMYWITDEDVKTLVIALRNKDYDNVHKQVERLLWQKNYTHKEIFDSLFRVVKESNLPLDIKMMILTKIGDTEFRISMKASEDIQLKALMAFIIRRLPERKEG